MAQPTLSSTALRIDLAALPAADLADAWQRYADGRLRIHCAGATPIWHYVVARVAYPDHAILAERLSDREMSILSRFLGGEQQKTIAFDAHIAFSTTSKWCGSALRKLRLERAAIPLPLVLAAQSWELGPVREVEAGAAYVEHAGSAYHVMVVPRPFLGAEVLLSPSEREVARRYVEGESRQQIAVARSTSIQTIACQLRSIGGKVGVSGRHALTRKGAELGWFRRRARKLDAGLLLVDGSTARESEGVDQVVDVGARQVERARGGGHVPVGALEGAEDEGGLEPPRLLAKCQGRAGGDGASSGIVKDVR
jgi:DNA-binding NarL/FixJ family response regulator